jgi:hypothetical protein
MPLFTMKFNGSTNEKDHLSRAIHAASIAADPEDDFSNFSFRWDQATSGLNLYYPLLPKPRTDQILMIEVLVSSGTGTNRKKVLLPP